VQIEQDRQRAERNLADTEYLAREVVALRMALTDVSEHVVTRDVLRQELKALLEDLHARDAAAPPARSGPAASVELPVFPGCDTRRMPSAGRRRVTDPELRRPLAELDMVRGVEVTGSSARVEIALTIVGCPAADRIERDVRNAAASAPASTMSMSSSAS
jgi:hypothetical protein